MRFDTEPRKPRRAAEIGQIDDEGSADHLGLELAQELDRGLRRAARGDQIVNEQHRFARGDGVLVNLDHVDAVFELVVLTDGLARQLALLADRDEAATQPVGHGAAQYEAARLDARDRLDAAIGEGLRQLLDAGPEAVGVGEQRGDVAEHDPGLRIVGDGAHEVLEIDFGRHRDLRNDWRAAPAVAYSRSQIGWLVEGRFLQPLSTRAATASSFLRSSGSRASGAVMMAVSSARSEPMGQGSCSRGKVRASRAMSRAPFSAFVISTLMKAGAVTAS